MRIRNYLLSSLILFGCGSSDNSSPLVPGSGAETGDITIPDSALPEQPAGPIEQFSRSNTAGFVVEEYQYYLSGSERIRHGQYRSYWDDGKRREEGAFAHGIKSQTWSYYDETGEGLISAEVWKDGVIQQQMTYYPDGTMRSETAFTEQGDVTSYFYENGKKEREGTYKNGFEVGVWTWYYENGNIKEEGTFVDGKWDGVWAWYRENGTVEYHRIYANGIERGVWSWWDEEGNKLRQEVWENGQRIERIECADYPEACTEVEKYREFTGIHG